MPFYIATDSPTLFWTGSGLSPEYPDALLYPTRGKAYTAYVKAREKTSRTDLRIVDTFDPIVT